MQQATPPPSNTEPALRRVHTCASLTALGVGGIIGSGIFVMAGMAAGLAGPALMVSCLVAGVAAIAAALCFAELASRVPVGGSVYAYVRAAFGPGPGWIAGWNFLLCIAVAGGSVASGWSHYVQDLLKSGGITLPTAFSTAPLAFGEGGIQLTGTVLDLPALLITLAITAIALRGIQGSLLANWGVLALKLGVLLFFILVGARFIRPDNWQPFAPLDWGVRFVPGGGPPVGMLAGASLMFYAYLGFEAVSAHTEEAKKPHRDVSLATVFAVLVATVLYVGVIAVLTGMVPFREIDPQAPLSDALRRAGLPWAGILVALGAIAALTNVLIVIVLTLSRVLLALGRDRLIAPMFGEVHPRYQTPGKATLVAGLGAGVLGTLVPLRILGDTVTLATLLAFLGVAVGVLALRRRQKVTPQFQAPLGPVVPVLTLVVCLLLAASLPPLTIVWLALWYLAGFAIYAAYGRRNGVSHLQPEALTQPTGAVPESAG